MTKKLKQVEKNKLIFWLPFIFLLIIVANILILFKYLLPFPPWKFNGIATLIYLLSLAIVGLALRKCKLKFKDIGYSNFRVKDIAWAFLFFILAIFVWAGVIKILEILGIPEWKTDDPFIDLPTALISLPFALLIAPITEETLFRGVLITALKEKVKLWPACVLSIFFFALHHLFPFGVGAFIHILFWAPFPTVLFIWKKSIYPSIIMHITNNIFGY
ncbi:MAG: type II CAAX endopeptidase family protein, partial [Candidatus Aenigmatarchaeota archaeon]